MFLLIANVSIAQNIQRADDGSILIKDAGSVFTALSFPAYVSMGVLFTMSDVSPMNSYSIATLVSNEKDGEERTVLQGEIPAAPHMENDETTTFINTFDLRQVPVQEPGIYKIKIKVNDDIVGEAKFKVVKTELD